MRKKEGGREEDGQRLVGRVTTERRGKTRNGEQRRFTQRQTEEEKSIKRIRRQKCEIAGADMFAQPPSDLKKKIRLMFFKCDYRSSSRTLTGVAMVSVAMQPLSLSDSHVANSSHHNARI